MSIERKNKSEELVEVELNGVIVEVDEDGNITYEDESYPWADPEDGSEWYETFGTAYPVDFVDKLTVVEDADSLISIMIPFDPGRYSVSCIVSLAYDVDVTEVVTRFKDEDGEMGEDVDDIFVEDVNLNEDESEISDFKCIRA